MRRSIFSSRISTICLITGALLLAGVPQVHAQTEDLYEAYKKSKDRPDSHYLLAQSEGDDAFDPFADYSEFDDDSDEEADINFFKHGRFLTMGFAGGLRGFTGNLSQMYGSGPSYGLFLSYFFDLRLALQLGVFTGDHAFTASGPTKTIDGNVSLTFITVDIKHFFNTQNVTRGLADLNPYILGGISQINRTVSVSGTEASGQDSTMGLNLGVGIEMPTMRKKGFFGLQATYRYFTFADENKPLLIAIPAEYATSNPNGDSVDFLAIIGLNY